MMMKIYLDNEPLCEMEYEDIIDAVRNTERLKIRPKEIEETEFEEEGELWYQYLTFAKNIAHVLAVKSGL
jgi:hypothetical protein